MLTQLSEKVFNSANPQDLWTPTHKNPSKCLLLLHWHALLCLQNTVLTAEAEPCWRTNWRLLSDLSLAPLVSRPNRGWQVTRLPFAGIDLLSLRALLAFNVAAPAHLALTRPSYLPALSVMASPTADSVTVLVLVALSGCSAQRVLAGSTETGWVLNVEQVHSAGDLVIQARQRLWLLLWLLLAPTSGDFSFPCGLVGGASNLDTGLIALLQLLADLMEG